MSEDVLDVRGQLCPIPVIRTQNRAKKLASGDTLVVRCTDPGALADIPAWCRIHGHAVVDTDENNDEIRISIRIS